MSTLIASPVTSAQVSAGAIDLNVLGLWRGHSPHEPSALAWPIALLPDFLQPSWRLPSDSVERYQHLWWTAPVPATPFEATREEEWAAANGMGTEVAVTTYAWAGRGPVAWSRVVCSTRERHDGHDRQPAPAPPRMGAGSVVRRLVVTDDQVRTFRSISGARYAAFASSSEAGLLGFNNIVVPGPLLVMVHLLAAGLPADGGDIEVWFRRPVTVGSSVEVVRSDHDPSVWSIRSVATNAELTVARCSGS